ALRERGLGREGVAALAAVEGVGRGEQRLLLGRDEAVDQAFDAMVVDRRRGRRGLPREPVGEDEFGAHARQFYARCDPSPIKGNGSRDSWANRAATSGPLPIMGVFRRALSTGRAHLGAALVATIISAAAFLGADWVEKKARERDSRSAAAFVLERELHLGAVGRDLALLDHHVLLDDLGDAQVAQRLRGAIDCRLGGLLPGIGAGADQLDHFVDALGHGCLPDTVSPLVSGAGEGRRGVGLLEFSLSRSLCPCACRVTRCQNLWIRARAAGPLWAMDGSRGPALPGNRASHCP